MQVQANSIASLILLALVIQTRSDGNDELKNESRRPRTQKRIVKHYAGVKREAIKCIQEGFQADVYDCTIFYQCVLGNRGKYTVFRHQCGPGTIFDIERNICNHPRSTMRSECTGWTIPPNPTTQENEVDSIEYEVVKRKFNTEPKKYSLTLLAQTGENISDIISNHEENPLSKELPHPITVKSFSNNIFDKISKQIPETTTPIINKNEHGNKYLVKTRSDKICNTQGFIGDSEDCRVFYRCVSNSRGGFIRFDYFCSDSTIWDDEVQACNHIWAVKKRSCGTRLSDSSIREEVKQTEHSSKLGSAQEQLPTSYGSKVTESQTQTGNGYVKHNNTRINNGNKNGKEPIRASSQNQTRVSYTSTESQLQTQMGYDDKRKQTQLQTDHKNTSSQSQTQETNLDATAINPYNTQSVNISEDTCYESGFKGVKNDCKKFYRCVENGKGYTKYDYICGEGTVWDSQIESCNHIWAVKNCGEYNNQNNKSTTQNIITNTKTTHSYQTTLEILPIENNDSGYNDESFQNQNHLSTSRTTSLTTKPENKPYTESIKNEFFCRSNGFFGDPKDCKKFYRCVDNGSSEFIKYEFKCGEGTLWDSTIEGCNHEWAVKTCGQNMDSNLSSVNSTTPITNIITTVSLVTVSTSRPTQIDEYDLAYGPPQQENQISSSTVSSTTIQQHQFSTCTTDGFFGVKDNCKKFYRCVENSDGGYTRYEFTCGEGTVWDQKIESCNHEWALPNCKSNIYDNSEQNETLSSTIASTNQEQNIQHTFSTETTTTITSTKTTKTTRPASNSFEPSQLQCKQDGFMGDTNDCRKFYRCVSNDQGGYNKYEFKCGEGTVWDQNLETCNHDLGNNNCITSDHVTITIKPVNENDSMHTESTILSTSIQDNITTTLINNPQIAKDECNTEGFFGNSNDCKRFYRCVDNGKGSYTKYDFVCGDGTIWDQEIEACNHNSNNKNCKNVGNVNSEGNSDEKPNTTNTLIISPTSTSSPKENTTELSSHETYDQCISEGFFANSKDCKKFYRCVKNNKGGYIKYDFTCGEGTIWFQEILSCDHDNEVKICKSNNDNKVTGSQNTATSQALSTTIDATSSTTNNYEDIEYTHENSSPKSPGECVTEGFYPNEQDCKRFYRCVDNGMGGFTKYDFTCGEGTGWDSEIQSCNHISKVKSCRQSNTESSSQSSDEQFLTTTHKTSTSIPNSECNMPTQDICKQEGYYGNSNDCKKFYRCVDNGERGLTKYEFICGEGTIWDQDVLTCNYPQDVANPSCQKNCSSTSSPISHQTSDTLSSTEDSKTTSGYETSSHISSDTSSDSSQIPENSNSPNTSSESSQIPENANITCSHAGFFADTNDCKKFYRCVDWDGTGEKYSVFHFECGDGTIWDPALETCNYKESVYPSRDCGKDQTQKENITESTTKPSTALVSSSTTSQKTTTTTQQSTSQKTSTTTTTEKSTTQKTTTTRKTTPIETTSHQATTESITTQPTTTEQNTTTQPTTNEQSTTTQPTTTEQSTTSQPAATEPSTTTQSTTTEQSTTTQPTTTEQTTIQQSTTTKPSTTQQSSATESTTTQQSTTTELTTTQKTTTDQTTTQQATTEQTTTEKTTTQQSTSQESSTEQSTTEGTTQESTTIQQSTTDGHTESTTENSSTSNECPETSNDQYLLVCPTSFRRHPKYCNLFYQCLEDDDTHEANIATFRCPNNTIYDESKVQCVEESKADKKCQGQIARRLKIKLQSGTNLKEPIVVDREKHSCTNEGHLPFEKQYECSTAFLKCQKTKSGDIKGFVYQCPPGYVYWSISRRCESSRKIINCRRSSNDWGGRWSIPIERTNIAT